MAFFMAGRVTRGFDVKRISCNFFISDTKNAHMLSSLVSKTFFNCAMEIWPLFIARSSKAESTADITFESKFETISNVRFWVSINDLTEVARVMWGGIPVGRGILAFASNVTKGARFDSESGRLISAIAPNGCPGTFLAQSFTKLVW